MAKIRIRHIIHETPLFDLRKNQTVRITESLTTGLLFTNSLLIPITGLTILIENSNHNNNWLR
jgi:hypothetical protein